MWRATTLFGCTALVGLLGLFGFGCTPVRAPTRASAALVEGAPREELAWATFAPETFARAKRERKFIVLDGSAEWCHWCHVMEATTYHDPAVRALLDKHFIAVKVDVDSRPDLEERYSDWGWPATIVFSPDAAEIAKYRGYIDPAKFVELLRQIVVAGEKGTVEPGLPLGDGSRGPLSEETLAWIQRFVEAELGDYYDEEEGGWGRSQKAPLGANNAWMLRRGLTDARAREQALFTLGKQAALIDPVWGGIYQYSAGSDWQHAHFEKLMTFQAPALDNYAEAYKLTRDAAQLARARSMHRYVDRFMKGPEGGFFASQDADVNAHDRSRPFVNGHDYYALPEAARLARGVPRVDTNEYGRENGLAIAAYVTLYQATSDPTVLASAEKAAARVVATHAAPSGGIAHDMSPDAKVLFLGDNAAFGFAMLRLHEATGKATYLDRASTIAGFMERDLADKQSGAFFSATKDPDATGVFEARRVPFEDNVMAVRMLARLAKVGPRGERAHYIELIGRILGGISTVEQIKARGRWLGDYLLALEETKGLR